MKSLLKRWKWLNEYKHHPNWAQNVAALAAMLFVVFIGALFILIVSKLASVLGGAGIVLGLLICFILAATPLYIYAGKGMKDE